MIAAARQRDYVIQRGRHWIRILDRLVDRLLADATNPAVALKHLGVVKPRKRAPKEGRPAAVIPNLPAVCLSTLRRACHLLPVRVKRLFADHTRLDLQ